MRFSSRAGSRLLAGLAMTAIACGEAEPRTDGAELVSGRSRSCALPTTLAQLPGALYEASGIVRDPRRADLFWVHNDSGNDAVLYGIDRAGNLLASVPLEGATNRDLEDIALGPCAAGNCLYLGDIGDNLGVHPFVTVHRIPLPPLPDAVVTTEDLGALRPDVSWRLVYEGGPRDAESLAIDASRGELVVVTKGRDGEVALFAASLASLHAAGGEPDTLRRVGRLPVPIGATTGQFITAGDISPDGHTLALRSYTTLYQFPWPGATAFDTTVEPSWASLASALEAQGEGLAWEADGGGFVLVSEGRGGRPPSLSAISCREAPEE